MHNGVKPHRPSGCSAAHCPVPPPPHPTFDLAQAVRAALDEDSAGIGDVTTLSTVNAECQAVGTFLAKSDGVLAGLAVADEVFKAVDPSLRVEWSQSDSDAVSIGTKFGRVSGPGRSLLVAERVALNFLQRMSGIATATAAMSHAVQGTGATVIDTRKTVPCLRALDKWAVRIGGGGNHRLGLFDMALIKDNHVTAAGSITEALRRCQAYIQQSGRPVSIEVETRTLAEVDELMRLVEAGQADLVTHVMLDNMARRDPELPGGVDVNMLRQAVDMVGGRLLTEASGNVTLETVGEIARTGVKLISCGALTHSVKAMDISLKIELL